MSAASRVAGTIRQALALDGLDSQILNVYWRSGSGAKAGGPAASPALSPSPSATVSATISPSAGDFGVLQLGCPPTFQVVFLPNVTKR